MTFSGSSLNSAFFSLRSFSPDSGGLTAFLLVVSDALLVVCDEDDFFLFIVLCTCAELICWSTASLWSSSVSGCCSTVTSDSGHFRWIVPTRGVSARFSTSSLSESWALSTILCSVLASSSAVCCDESKCC